MTKDWPKCFFFTWVGHGKRPAPFRLWYFTMANPGVKKTFWPVFYPAKKITSFTPLLSTVSKLYYTYHHLRLVMIICMVLIWIILTVLH